MSEDWKRFLLQWVLPVGVFGVVLVFLFAGFDANIKQKSSEDYRRTLVTSTEDYSSDIYNSVQKSQAVAQMAADVIVNRNLPKNECLLLLKDIVDYSDAYMAIVSDDKGNAFSNEGVELDISQVSYFEELYADGTNTYQFLPQDGITGGACMILGIDAMNNRGDFKLLIYYPMTASAIKKIVNVEEKYDINSGIMITNPDGEILVSTKINLNCTMGDNIWDKMASSNNAATLRRCKTKLQAGSAGTFDAVVNGISYCVCYSVIPGTNQELMIFLTNTSVSKSESKLVKSSINRLGLVVVAIIIFIVTVTTLNIVQIYIQSKNRDDLKDKADRDQLTGLKNKIATEREIKEYIENNPDSLAMMFLVDIDNFKKINDTMGHAFGDEVLRELGRHIGINFRVSDIIGRTGGDEFTIFLKNLKEDANTLKEAQKLVYFFKHFQVGDYVKYTVTASIGAAVFPAHGAEFETLYKAADAAVYKSKKRGKNQLSFYDDRDRTPEEVAYADSHLIDISRKSDVEGE